MKTWSKRKKWVIGGLVVVMVLLLAVRLWPMERPTLASLSSVHESVGPENRQGRFSVQNKSTNLIILQQVGVDVFSEGRWTREGTASSSHVLLPGQSGALQFNPPSDSRKWRGVLIVIDPQNEMAAQSGGGISLWYSTLAAVARGGTWLRGTMDTDGEVVTREIEP